MPTFLAWRIPGTGEPGGLPSLGLHRVGHDGSDLAAAAADKIKSQKTYFSHSRRIITNYLFLHQQTSFQRLARLYQGFLISYITVKGK